MRLRGIIYRWRIRRRYRNGAKDGGETMWGRAYLGRSYWHPDGPPPKPHQWIEHKPVKPSRDVDKHTE